MIPADRRAAAVRIVLIGFMAAGKSTVGRLLARRLGWDFVDLDTRIEERTGLSVSEIFRRHGEPAFRALEAELTEELAGREGMVLAPGGGWIAQPDLLDRLGAGSWVVWLRISAEEAVRRATAAATHRPLLAGPDPLERARRLLRSREPYYRAADAVMDVDGRAAGEIAAEIHERMLR